MKKWIALPLALGIVVLLCDCGKSEELVRAEEASLAIGEVTLDQAEAVEEAEKLYQRLTDKEKEAFEYHSLLTEAREELDALVLASEAEACMRTIYSKADSALFGTSAIASDIKAAWLFSIEDASENYVTDMLYFRLALRLSEEAILEIMESMG